MALACTLGVCAALALPAGAAYADVAPGSWYEAAVSQVMAQRGHQIGRGGRSVGSHARHHARQALFPAKQNACTLHAHFQVVTLRYSPTE